MQNDSQPAFSKLFDLKADQASYETIDSTIRSAGQVSGTNMWVLMFAIVIASVGLNVNSPATIIGAMLISPLMGPIIGIGYGAGIKDFALIRKSLRNLATFTAISLLASTLYFLVTPLQDAQSELLSRTTPNIWDVLIAFFGGAAGMVGLTRKEKSTTIPGVAIATALMPPLCTVGYGLATGQPRFFFGALYLFAINGVFIALATLTIARILRLPKHRFADAAAGAHARLVIGFIVAATLLPSVFLAAKLVKEQVFLSEAQRYIRALSIDEKDLIVTSNDVDPEQKVISLFVVGADSSESAQKKFEAKLQEFRLNGARLDLHLASAGQRASTTKNQANQVQQQKPDQQLAQLRVLQEQIEHTRSKNAEYLQLEREIRAQSPALEKVSIAREVGADAAAEGATDAGESVLVVIESAQPVAKSQIQRLEAWLAVRLPNAQATVLPVVRARVR
jgi:uncharacterized hydrophobic protein (TIGR00271 family)